MVVHLVVTVQQVGCLPGPPLAPSLPTPPPSRLKSISYTLKAALMYCIMVQCKIRVDFEEG
jgi:hypothetical protein